MNPGELLGVETSLIRTGMITERVDQVRSRLEQIASGIPSTEKITRLLERTECCVVDTTIVKDRAVRQIAQLDKNGTGVIVKNLDDLATEMDKLIINSDVELLASYRDRDWGRLKEASDLIENYQNECTPGPVMSPLTRLNRAVKTNQVARVRATAGDIATLCHNPNIPWNELVRQGVVTQDFMDNVDIVGNYLEMATKWHIIESESTDLDKSTIKALRAKAFFPYLDKNIAPEMIDQIVEGNFDMGEEFVNGALTMFAEIAEEIESPTKKLSKKQKMVMSVVLTSMVLTVATANYQLPIPSMADFRRQESALIAKQKSEQVQGKDKGVSNTTSASSRNSHSKVENSGSNSESEAVAKVANALWKLQGKNLDGYYRTNTASEFYFHDDGFGWRMPGMEDTMAYYPSLEKKPDIIASRKLNYLPEIIDLPTKYGQDVDSRSVVVTVDGQQLRDKGQYYVAVDSSDNYLIYLDNVDTGKIGDINVSYGLRNVNAQLSHYKNQYDIAPIVDLSNANDFPMFKQIMQRYEGNQVKMAYAFRDWIRKDFIYSLDPKQSDYYQAADSREGFFQRAIERKKVDCDVANTILIGHLRAAGIESRMAFGFYNARGKAASQLTENEGHGWVEAYLNGKWTILDATPTKIDRFTEKQMRAQGTRPENGDKGDSDGTPAESSIELVIEQGGQDGGDAGELPGLGGRADEVLKDVLATMESVKEWSQSNDELLKVLLLAFYKGLLIGSYRNMRRGLRNADKAHDKIADMINKECRDAEGKPTIPANSLEATKSFFYRIMDEKASLPAGTGIGGVLKKTATWLTLPLTGTYASALRQETEVNKTDERLQVLPQKLAELKAGDASIQDVDLIKLFGEMAGYSPADIERTAIRVNTNAIADNIAGRIGEFGQYSDICPVWADDQEVVNRIKRRLTRGFLEYQQGLPSASIRQARHFKDEQSYLRYLAKKAYKDYRWEAKRRLKATRKDEYRRNDNEKRLAIRHPMTLTKKEFIKTFSNSDELRPFRVIYHLAQNNDLF